MRWSVGPASKPEVIAEREGAHLRQAAISEGSTLVATLRDDALTLTHIDAEGAPSIGDAPRRVFHLWVDGGCVAVDDARRWCAPDDTDARRHGRRAEADHGRRALDVPTGRRRSGCLLTVRSRISAR